MDINALTELRKNLPQGTAARDSSLDFMAMIAAAGGITPNKKVDTDSMSMTEYKIYIYNVISALTFDNSDSRDFIAVNISDEGFEAMKNDPEYEAHVLQSIRANFSFTDHYHSSNYSILPFGATEEEFHGESVSGGSPFMEKEEGFWDRRAKRREKLQEQYEEMLDQKAIAEQLGQPFIFTPDLFESMETEGN